MTDQPDPIRKGLLPCIPPPEWEFHTVYGARTGTDGCTLFPGGTGPVVVRRRVTYGDWEPVCPDRWAPEPPSEAADGRHDAPQTADGQPDAPEARNGAQTAAQGSALRDLIAAAIWERQNPGRRWADCEYRWRADAEADAAAVLGVILPLGKFNADMHRDTEQQLAAIIDYARTHGVVSIDRIRHILEQPAGPGTRPT